MGQWASRLKSEILWEVLGREQTTEEFKWRLVDGFDINTQPPQEGQQVSEMFVDVTGPPEFMKPLDEDYKPGTGPIPPVQGTEQNLGDPVEAAMLAVGEFIRHRWYQKKLKRREADVYGLDSAIAFIERELKENPKWRPKPWAEEQFPDNPAKEQAWQDSKLSVGVPPTPDASAKKGPPYGARAAKVKRPDPGTASDTRAKDTASGEKEAPDTEVKEPAGPRDSNAREKEAVPKGAPDAEVKAPAPSNESDVREKDIPSKGAPAAEVKEHIQPNESDVREKDIPSKGAPATEVKTPARPSDSEARMKDAASKGTTAAEVKAPAPSDESAPQAEQIPSRCIISSRSVTVDIGDNELLPHRVRVCILRHATGDMRSVDEPLEVMMPNKHHCVSEGFIFPKETWATAACREVEHSMGIRVSSSALLPIYFPLSPAPAEVLFVAVLFKQWSRLPQADWVKYEELPSNLDEIDRIDMRVLFRYSLSLRSRDDQKARSLSPLEATRAYSFTAPLMDRRFFDGIPRIVDGTQIPIDKHPFSSSVLVLHQASVGTGFYVLTRKQVQPPGLTSLPGEGTQVSLSWKLDAIIRLGKEAGVYVYENNAMQSYVILPNRLRESGEFVGERAYVAMFTGDERPLPEKTTRTIDGVEYVDEWQGGFKIYRQIIEEEGAIQKNPAHTPIIFTQTLRRLFAFVCDVSNPHWKSIV